MIIALRAPGYVESCGTQKDDLDEMVYFYNDELSDIFKAQHTFFSQEHSLDAHRDEPVTMVAIIYLPWQDWASFSDLLVAQTGENPSISAILKIKKLPMKLKGEV